jgi:amino-acid N-acetyltransferase
MNNQINYRYAKKEYLENIISLLKENELPIVDIDLIKIKFILAETGDKLVGCIGIEPYEKEGLLRSLAVNVKYRNSGIGNNLLQYLISYSKQMGINNLHLLTTTAESYFLSKNFVKSDRETAPDSIKNTIEFSSLCPSSSSHMVFYNIG